MPMPAFLRRLCSAARKRRATARHLRFLPRLEELEPRWVPATITVNSAGDADSRDNVLTLREAILIVTGALPVVALTGAEQAQVNAAASDGRDTIAFAIPGPGVQTITPTTALPTLTKPVVVDGYTQPGAAPNRRAVGSDAVLLIQLDGSGAGAVNGLVLAGGNSVVQGLVINRFSGGTSSGNAVVLQSNGNLVAGNFLGTDAAGTQALGNSANGVLVQFAANNTIGGPTPAARNVLSANLSHGVELRDSTATVVAGNYIGTDAGGTAALGNAGNGVFLVNPTTNPGQANNTIGGTTPGAGNVIAGNQGAGVNVLTHGNAVFGNFIGTDATGLRPLGNFGPGVQINVGRNNLVGDFSASARNVIAGNLSHGVALIAGAAANAVRGNYIGLNAPGTAPLGNAGAGVLLNAAVGNVIGGAGDGAGNVIAANQLSGVVLTDNTTTGNRVEGNRIGTLADGVGPAGNARDGVFIAAGAANNFIGGVRLGEGNTIAFNGGNGVLVGSDPALGQTTLAGPGNAIRGNAIFDNARLGIDLGPNDGVTPNDPGDVDGGPNGLQNFPVLTAITVVGTDATIVGKFHSTPNTSFTLEFFGNAVPDPSGFGEGQRFLGSAQVTTNEMGDATFSVTLNVGDPPPAFSVTATNNNTQSTSEFSRVFNKPPTGTDGTVTTLEDTAYVFSPADFGFSDAQDKPPDNFLAVAVTALPSNGTLLNDGQLVQAGDFISVAAIAAGQFRFLPGSNDQGAPYTSFAFQVQDDGGILNGGRDLDPSANLLTIDVTSVNDAPAGANATVTTLEDTAYVFAAADFGFRDPNDVPANAFLAVRITTLPGVGTLSNNGLPVQAGDVISVADIDAGRLAFRPAVNASGSPYASFTFQVQDDAGTSNNGNDLDPTADTLTVNVVSLNDAPTGTDNTVATLEDSDYIFGAADFGFSDADDTPSNNFLAVRITTLPSSGTLINNGAAVQAGDVIRIADIDGGQFRFTPVNNANGSPYTSFTFQVQDDGGTTDGGVALDPTANVLNVNVLSVNDAPAGADATITTLEDTAYVFGVADFGFSDANDAPPNAVLAVVITTLPNAGTLTNDGTPVQAGDFIRVAVIDAGRLRFTPGSHANGSPYTTFTFQVQDDGGNDNGGTDLDPTANVLSVNVLSVNDAPAGTDSIATTLEDTAYVFSAADFGFSDVNDVPPNKFLAVRIATLPNVGTLTNNGTMVQRGDFVSVADINAGRLRFTPVINANGSPYANFTFQVQDAGGTSNNGSDLDPTANTLTVNVLSVNDAPAGADAAVTTLEDTAYVFSAADFGFRDVNDAPPNNFLAVRIAALPGVGTLTNNGAMVQVGDFISVADIDTGRLTFQPAANGLGSPYTSFAFQVQDGGGTLNGGRDLDPSANVLTIDVTSVNDAPAGANATVTTLEDMAYVFAAADFGFRDPNDVPPNAFLAVRITTLPGVGTLSNNGLPVQAGDVIRVADIDGDLFRFTPVNNANGSPYTSFTFQVQDDGGTSNNGSDLDPTPNLLTVNVLSVNDAPAGADAVVTTLEDAAYVFSAADFGFRDVNDAPPNSFLAVRIAALPGVGTLSNKGAMVQVGDFIAVADIDAGRLRFTPVSNANGSPYAHFTFQVQDDGGTSNNGRDLDPTANTLAVNVLSVNDAPAGADAAVTTPEDTAYVFAAADFGFRDAGDAPPNNLLAVRISTLPGVGTLTNNGASVQLGDFIAVADISAGRLRFQPAANTAGAPYTGFTFQVQDDGGIDNGGRDLDPTANTLTLNVLSVNDAPAGTDSTATTLEDAAYVFSAADFGFRDVNDAPPNGFLAVRITTLPGVGTLSNNGLPVQAGDVIRVADIDGDLFRFTPVSNANGSPYTSFTFQVQDDGGTTDGGVALDASANTLTVNVVSVNDAPAGTDGTVTTLEDNDYTFGSADFGFRDADDTPSNSLLAVRIATLPSVGTLSNNGLPVQAGDFIRVADIDGGLFRYTPASNANGSPYTSFTFQVQDDGGTTDGGVALDPTADTLAVNVLSVNDAPAGVGAAVTTLEDAAYVFSAADFGFRDVNDAPPNNLLAVRITTLPGVGTLSNNGAPVQAGDFITVADIDAGRLRFTPVSNANGSPYTSFTFQVQDAGGTSNNGGDLDSTANTLTVNVLSVNDAPAGADAAVATPEDTAYAFSFADFGFSDPDDTPPNAFRAVRIATLPNVGTLRNNGVRVKAGDLIGVADIDAGRFTFTPAADGNGAPYARFTFQVQDDGGTSNKGSDLDPSPNTVTVTVRSVNDAPVGADATATTLEDLDYVFGTADFGFTDPRDAPPNNFFAVRIATLPSSGTLSNAGTPVQAGDFISVADLGAGRFRFTPLSNDHGSPYTSFTFQVQDDGAAGLAPTANLLTVNVLSVNDPPASTDATATTPAGTAHVFDTTEFGFSDRNDAPADDFLAVQITTLPDAGTLFSNGTRVQAGDFIRFADIAAGRFTFRPAPDGFGEPYTSFTFQVQDDGQGSNGGLDRDPIPDTMIINVLSVPGAPGGGNGPTLLPPPIVPPGLVGLPVGDAATLISLVRAQENRDRVADAVRLLSFKLSPEDPGVSSRFFEELEELPLRFFLLSSAAEEEPQIGGIRGKVFVDRNGNGNQEEGEPGLRGQVVFLDLNNNGGWDPGEPFCETDGEGRYVFSGLGLMRYTVRQNLRRQGIVQTLPQRNLPHVVQLTRQNSVVADRDFGIKIPRVLPSDTSGPDTEPEPAKEKEPE